MIIEIKIPSPGESITEVEIGKWLVEDGEIVEKDQEIGEVESDKATLTLIAEAGGKIGIKAGEGDTVSVGAVVCLIDTEYEVPRKVSESKPKEAVVETKTNASLETDLGTDTKPEQEESVEPESTLKITPVAKKMMDEQGVNVDDILKGLKRIGKREVQMALGVRNSTSVSEALPAEKILPSREKMTRLRQKLSERLVAVKNETAMLTTFNEIDMSAVINIRMLYQERFVEKHGIKLGFMSFFTKAVAEVVRYHPRVNSMIDGDEIVDPGTVNVGIAVQTPKGLMVPVVRNAQTKSLPELEYEIKILAEKARNKKISIDELSGGTISITNGGVFGSLLSTPILNPPQSAILGMHAIIDRPVAIDGKVEIRPMMYVALSYDHRLIDGKDSVGFLLKVKEFVENPLNLWLGKNVVDQMLDL